MLCKYIQGFSWKKNKNKNLLQYNSVGTMIIPFIIYKSAHYILFIISTYYVHIFCISCYCFKIISCFGKFWNLFYNPSSDFFLNTYILSILYWYLYQTETTDMARFWYRTYIMKLKLFKTKTIPYWSFCKFRYILFAINQDGCSKLLALCKVNAEWAWVCLSGKGM